MNTNPQISNGTFRFTAAVDFEITPDAAASLLVESDPSRTVAAWLEARRPASASGYYNMNSLREAMGKYLAERKVCEARTLLPSADVKLLEGE